MAFEEAEIDGIRHERGAYGDTWYFPKCANCGREVANLGYEHGKIYLCKKCRLEKQLADKKVRDVEDYDLKERKFENAIKRIFESLGDDRKRKYYTEAIEVVHEKLHTHGWFESTEEIMAAIELLRHEVKIRHQVKFGTRYRADFVLPELKIVLECDGTCYHNEFTRSREELRDSLILAGLGPEWEIIRITDVLINQKITQLLPALKKVKKRRQEVRAKNGGYLPEWYTDRKMA